MAEKINLTCELEVTISQVMGVLNQKIEGHAFVAFLILALEEESGLGPEIVQNILLPTMPLRASENLLKRLTDEGYFIKTGDVYELTTSGRENAYDKSYWTEEKAVFEISQVDCPFLSDLPLQVRMDLKNSIDEKGKKLKEGEKEALEGKEFWAMYKGERGNFQASKLRFSKLENIRITLPKKNWPLELNIEKEKEAKAKIKPRNGDIISPPLKIQFSYEEALDEILENDEKINWDGEKGIIWVPFNPQELAFDRRVTISQPRLRSQKFQPTTLPLLPHVPATQSDADQWNLALVLDHLDRYFLTEKQFDTMATEVSKKFAPWWNVNPITRQNLINHLQSSENTFYPLAKLTTIDYLNY